MILFSSFLTEGQNSVKLNVAIFRTTPIFNEKMYFLKYMFQCKGTNLKLANWTWSIKIEKKDKKMIRWQRHNLR